MGSRSTGCGGSDADFDHLVRVLTSPCDPLTEVAAAGQSDGCTTAGSGADVHVDLEARLALPGAPAPLLAPGARRWLSDESAPVAIETGEPVPFDSTRGGAVVVCRGPCGDSALNVVDVVGFSEGEDHPPLPNGASFAPLGLSGIVAAVDESHLSRRLRQHRLAEQDLRSGHQPASRRGWRRLLAAGPGPHLPGPSVQHGRRFRPVGWDHHGRVSLAAGRLDEESVSPLGPGPR